MRTKKPKADKRIYCVVASTVQNGLIYREGKPLHVVQPIGRQIAQACHAVSTARYFMLRKSLLNAVKNVLKIRPSWLAETIKLLFPEAFTPVTTIILEARDSFELQHVYDLLQKEGISVYEFKDTEQPDYGDENSFVRTAIATEPVTREAVVGLLDYLPLWGS